jgi:hypothetical protein
MSSFAVLPLAGFLALISAAVFAAAAQSPSPPVHAKPHPGVPLVKPDAPPDALGAPPAPQNPDGKQATEDSKPPASTDRSKAPAESKPGPAAAETHRATHPVQSKSHASATAHASVSSRTSATKVRSAAVRAQTQTGGATTKAMGSVMVARTALPASQRLIAQSTPPPVGKPSPGVAGQHAGGNVAESGNFSVSQLGHAVGTAEFRIARSAAGYDSTATVRVNMQGLDYALSKTEQLDAADHIQHVVLSATVNGQAVSVNGKPDGPQFLLNISANGRSSTTRLAAHPAAVFLPDFDPGGLETLLTLAAAQNGRDLWAILPKQAGSIEAVQLATYADEHGTLDGRPVIVHHLVATIAGAETDLFADADNHVLQAELPQQGFTLVRKGFVLTPPRRPLAPSQD